MNNRIERKFKIGDRVQIVHDEYKSYPKGSKGTITFVGAYHASASGRAVPRYHVKMENGEILTRELQYDWEAIT